MQMYAGCEVNFCTFVTWFYSHTLHVTFQYRYSACQVGGWVLLGIRLYHVVNRKGPFPYLE
jgi:hypothetical protein